MRSQYTLYDPETFEIVVEAGQIVSNKIARRLQGLRASDGRTFYEVTVISLLAQGRKKRRRGAIAQVGIYRNGSGKILVNGQPAEDYFRNNRRWRSVMLEPFQVLHLDVDRFDIVAYVRGATPDKGQRQTRAIAHALAGALAILFPEKEGILRQAGFKWTPLRRDKEVNS
jgi:ribosomal protein S9